MGELERAISDLKTILGDFLARHREDGVFFVQLGGPGSVPALRNLDVPELHLDLLPGKPTDEQKAGLASPGYRPDGQHSPLHITFNALGTFFTRSPYMVLVCNITPPP